jgi:hypothetical protein
METRYRLLPRQFGEYLGERIVEYDEVCIATNTMSYQDYLDCRGFSLVFLALASKQYDFVRLSCEELDVNWFDLLLKIWHAQQVDSGELGKLYQEFITASQNKLFDSPENLKEFVQTNENYKRLLNRDIEETIMRNFVPRMIIDHFPQVTLLVVSVFRNMGLTPDWLPDLQAWVTVTRDIGHRLDIKSNSETEQLEKSVRITQHWNIEDWLLAPKTTRLKRHSPPKAFTVIDSNNTISRAKNSMIKLYGPDRLRWPSRLLEAKPLEEMWQKTTAIDSTV